jgi:large subunit ribosomal protein L10
MGNRQTAPGALLTVSLYLLSFGGMDRKGPSFLFFKVSNVEKTMGLTREQKKDEVEALKAGFEQDEMIVVTQYSGLTVKQLTELRNALRAEGAKFKVSKNTLARRAVAGTKFEGIGPLLKGPTGLATSSDPMAAARIVYNFAKTNDKLVILGGANSQEVLSLETLKFLATLPSLDALRSKLIGILQAPGAQLARLANAYATKEQEA